MWGQADRNTMVLKPITENGWTIENTKLCVVWDTEENMQLVRERVNLLLRGCKCVTGCKNSVCGCKGKNSKYTEGCQCINCENEVSPAVESDELSVIALEEEVQSSGNSYLYEDEEHWLDRVSLSGCISALVCATTVVQLAGQRSFVQYSCWYRFLNR